jgi:hypothetical protein
MKAKLFSVFLFASLSSAFAQTNEEYYIASKKKVKLEDRISGSVMLGSSLTFMNGTNIVSGFVAPKLNYKVSSRFSLTAGLIHQTFSPGTNRRSYGCFPDAEKKYVPQNLFFAGGEYSLNKKVMLSGAVMMNVSNNRNFQNNFKAISLGMDYKITERSSIGFRASISEGSMDYMYDQRNGAFQYQPFQNSAFGNTMNGFGQWGSSELNRMIR